MYEYHSSVIFRLMNSICKANFGYTVYIYQYTRMRPLNGLKKPTILITEAKYFKYNILSANAHSDIHLKHRALFLQWFLKHTIDLNP